MVREYENLLDSNRYRFMRINCNRKLNVNMYREVK